MGGRSYVIYAREDLRGRIRYQHHAESYENCLKKGPGANELEESATTF